MMLPVSKWTRTRSDWKLSTNCDHLLRAVQEAVDEDVLDVQVDAGLLGLGDAAGAWPRVARRSQTSCGTGGSSSSHGMYDRPGHDQQVLGAQELRGADHLDRQFQPLLAALRVLVRQRVRPEQERADAADLEADLAGQSRRSP